MSKSHAKLIIDLDALVHNYKTLERIAAPARCAAAVKANAYGLGIDPIASSLFDAGCNDFFVATLDEAITLRALVPTALIYVLNGVRENEVSVFHEHDLIPVLNTIGEMDLWLQLGLIDGEAQPGVLHIDTGMNRLGIPVSDIEDNQEQLLEKVNRLNLTLVMSHLACSDNQDHPMNAQQLKLFNEIRGLFSTTAASLANTEGVLLGASYHHHMVRPGIGLYGGTISAQEASEFQDVVRLEAPILQLKTVPKGSSVGYDATWVAEKDSLIATVALGYADGYALSFSNKSIAIVHGMMVPVVGRISMDLLTLDVSALGRDNVEQGERAIFLGDGLHVKDIAAKGNMHSYQMLTTIGSRVSREYIKAN